MVFIPSAAPELDSGSHALLESAVLPADPIQIAWRSGRGSSSVQELVEIDMPEPSVVLSTADFHGRSDRPQGGRSARKCLAVEKRRFSAPNYISAVWIADHPGPSRPPQKPLIFGLKSAAVVLWHARQTWACFQSFGLSGTHRMSRISLAMSAVPQPHATPGRSSACPPRTREHLAGVIHQVRHEANRGSAARWPPCSHEESPKAPRGQPVGERPIIPNKRS
jgi:hypothetical protein